MEQPQTNSTFTLQVFRWSWWTPAQIFCSAFLDRPHKIFWKQENSIGCHPPLVCEPYNQFVYAVDLISLKQDGLAACFAWLLEKVNLSTIFKVHLEHHNIEGDLSQTFYFSSAVLGLSSTVLPRLEHAHMWANFPLLAVPFISQNVREEEHVYHLTTQ